ncbi:hypothetical protein JCM8547_005627 [Rhodosporidiobolus lusitaniae]
MASPSSSTASYGYAPHPQYAGKGLPQQHSSAPSYSAYAHPHRHPGPPPDLTQRYKIKAKYHKMQKRYVQFQETRKDLILELAEKEAKVQQLQDEVDLILDQIAASDYAHLRPKLDDLFSDDEGDEAEEEGDGEGEIERVKGEDDEMTGATTEGGKKKRRRSRVPLDELEDKRRRELEEQWGFDGSKQQATLPPIDPAFVSPAQLDIQQQPPQQALPKLKLKFGGGGAQ